MTTYDYDHHSPHYTEHWREMNEELRTKCPVAHSEAHGGFWVVSRYADVAAAAHDDDTFSSYQELPDGSHHGAVIPSQPKGLRQLPIEMDPPEFFSYRKLLTPWFSPRKADLWGPCIREIITYCIDEVIEAGSADLVTDVVAPVPSIVTLLQLGLPVDNWREFSDIVHTAQHAVPGTDEYFAAMMKFLGIKNQVEELIPQRRAEPKHDLISYLARSRVDGELVSDERVSQMITLLLAGGIDTSTSLLGKSLEWLGRHHNERTRLQQQPELMGTATEEFLRYFTPIQALARTATRDCELGGEHIKAGDRLLLSWGSANFDAEMFKDPDEVKLDRFPNRHQAFGLGIHRCVGSNLARVEFRVVMEEILQRMPDYVITGARHYPSIGVMNGWVSLPATFTPGQRKGTGELPEPPSAAMPSISEAESDSK